VFGEIGPMMVQWTETCRRVFNIDYQCMLCYWLKKNYCIIVNTTGWLLSKLCWEVFNEGFWLSYKHNKYELRRRMCVIVLCLARDNGLHVQFYPEDGGICSPRKIGTHL
jgi:hypothetical protein